MERKILITLSDTGFNVDSDVEGPELVFMLELVKSSILSDLMKQTAEKQ